MSVHRKPLSNEDQQAICDLALEAAEAMGFVDDALAELEQANRRDEER